MMVYERRCHPWQRAAMWLLAPLVDRWTGLSLTRFLAIYFAHLAGVAVYRGHGVVTGNIVWLSMVSISAAFGKHTFEYLLARTQRQDTTTETVTVTADLAKIAARRDTAAGVEATD